MKKKCLPTPTIAAFADGKLKGKERQEVIFHINRCESCSSIFSETLYLQEKLPNLIFDIDLEISTHSSHMDQEEIGSILSKVPKSKTQQLYDLNDALKKDAQGAVIIKNNVLLAMGCGLIPLPFLDIMGASAIQIKMLKQLASLYQIPFIKHLGKSSIGLLIGGLGSSGLSCTGLSLVKAIPGFGLTGGIVLVPLATGASTYAVGKVFFQHFATGGSFLDFNPEAVRNHFSELYAEGRAVVSGLNSGNSKNHFQVA